MIIDIDIGNTRIKWRIAGDPDIFFFHRADEFPEQWKSLPKDMRFRISSVRDENQTRQFCQQLASLTHGAIEIATVKNSVAGVSVAYRDVATFGVDRWLALLAARTHHPAADCVVIHAGTALVADFMRADGQHLGGYIIAGWQASLRALGEAAHALKFPAEGVVKARRTAPGTTTLECIDAGMSLLFRGFLGELVRAASINLKSPVWTFAGGDAETMLQLYKALETSSASGKFASGDPQFAPGLVLDGLAVALP